MHVIENCVALDGVINSWFYYCSVILSFLVSCVYLCNWIIRAVPEYSFMDYIKGGCEINLMVAIDFTVGCW